MAVGPLPRPACAWLRRRGYSWSRGGCLLQPLPSPRSRGEGVHPCSPRGGRAPWLGGLLSALPVPRERPSLGLEECFLVLLVREMQIKGNELFFLPLPGPGLYPECCLFSESRGGVAADRTSLCVSSQVTVSGEARSPVCLARTVTALGVQAPGFGERGSTKLLCNSGPPESAPWWGLHLLF